MPAQTQHSKDRMDPVDADKISDPSTVTEAKKQLFDEGIFLARYPTDMVDIRPCRRWVKSSHWFGANKWKAADKPVPYKFPDFEDPAVRRSSAMSVEFRLAGKRFFQHRQIVQCDDSTEGYCDLGFLGDAALPKRSKESANRVDAHSEMGRDSDDTGASSWAGDSDEEDLVDISEEDEEDIPIADLGLASLPPPAPSTPASTPASRPKRAQPKVSQATSPATRVAEAESPVPMDLEDDLKTPAARLRAALAGRGGEPAQKSARVAHCKDAVTPEKPQFAMTLAAVRDAPGDLRRMAKAGDVEMIFA